MIKETLLLSLSGEWIQPDGIRIGAEKAVGTAKDGSGR